MTTSTANPRSATDAAFGDLVEELTARFHAGDVIDTEEILRHHPEHAERLRDLLPALKLLADLSQSVKSGGAAMPIVSDEPVTGLLGDFRILREVGRGGMGIVYEAEQISLNRKVALKVLPFAATMDPRHLQRFRNEAQAAACLHHTNIVPVHGVGCERGVHYYAMQLIEGQTLAQVIADCRLSIDDCNKEDHASTSLPIENRKSKIENTTVAALTTKRDKATFRHIADLIAQAADALEYAHSMGVVHRDIKPGNLMLDNAGHLWITDFGLAKLLSPAVHGAAEITMTGDLIGTLRYMSPEQALARHGLVDHRTDVYSLGATLYELLTLQPAVAGADKAEILKSIAWEEPIALRRHDKSIPAELETITLKCLAKKPEERYATAGEVAEELRRWMGDQSIKAKPPGLLQKVSKWAGRHRGVTVTAALSIAVILLLSVAGLAINNWLVMREKEQTTEALNQAVREKERADQNLARAREAVKQYLLKTSESAELRAADFHDLRKKLLETAIPFYMQFVQESQDDPKLEEERAKAHFELSRVRQEIGDLEPALNDLAEAESIVRRLMQAAPEDFTLRQRVAEAHSARAGILQELGRNDEAGRAYQTAFDTLEVVAATHTSNREYRESMARMCFNRGEYLATLSRPQEAEALLRRSVGIREELLKERPDESAVRVQLARSWINLGFALRALRRGDAAENAFQSAADLLNPQILDKLAVTGEQLADWQKARGHAFNNLGVVRSEAGRLADAAEANRIAVKIKEQLSEQFPSVPQYRYELAGSYNNLGTLLKQGGQPGEARAAYEQAVQIGERLVAGFPALPLYAVALAGAYTNLGRHIGDLGELDASLPWLTKAVDTLESHYLPDSRVAKVRESLLTAHWARALTLCGLQRFGQALPDWDRAIELDDGKYYVSLRIKRASSLLHLNDHARATADAQAIADSAKATAKDLYLAASVHAHAARLAHDDAAQVEQYGARAVALLRQASAKGYSNPERWKDDGDLKSLRDRADFQELLDGLGVKRE